jgi:DNA-binding NarL/FixJ family response regulator
MVLRVGCIDGSTLCLLGIQRACEDARFQWQGGFQSFVELEPILASQSIDVLISEIRIGKDDMLDYWHEQSNRNADIKLILYTHNDNPTHVARAASCGAWDYITKRQSTRRLIDACNSVTEKDHPNGSIIPVAKRYFRSVPDYQGSEGKSLTPKERQVLAHLAFGLSNREVSTSMGISLETVKEHVQNVLRKLKTKDRTAAAVWAIRNGLPKLNVDLIGLVADGHTE